MSSKVDCHFSCTFSWRHERTVGWICPQFPVVLMLWKNRAIQMAVAIFLWFFSHLFSFVPSIIQRIQTQRKKPSGSVLCFYDNVLWRCCLLCVVWSLLIEYVFVYRTQKLIWLLYLTVFHMSFYCLFPLYFTLEYTFLTACLLWEYLLQ